MRHYPALTIRAASAASDFGDLLAATLDDFGPIALEEIEDGAALRAFFSTVDDREAASAALKRIYPSAHIERAEVSDEDWAARSQASLIAIRVGALTVAPPWDVPAERGDVIVILPSMGFGTGHHATTRLCLKALQTVEVHEKSVLDVGTGSGVLALAAAKLGASRVVGIDNDPDAIGNAVENRDLNALEVEFRCEGVENAATDRTFDVVLANLTGGMLVKSAGVLDNACARGGALILSGLREEEEAIVRDAFRCSLEAQATEDGWVALILRKSKSTD